MPRLYVTIEGGTVSRVCSDRPAQFDGIEIVVVDYDTDGMEEKELTLVTQKDGSVELALVVHIQEVVAADISLDDDADNAADPPKAVAKTGRREIAGQVLPVVKEYKWIEKRRRVRNPRAVIAARRERCELCASRNGPLHVHHVKSRGARGNDVAENLVCLCWRCHDEVHRGVIARDVFLAFVRRRNEIQGRFRAR
jgi:hypothetical protein